MNLMNLKLLLLEWLIALSISPQLPAQIRGLALRDPDRTSLMTWRVQQGKVRPVLWRTMGFEKVAVAHQLMRENKHLGKISILVGASEEGQGKTADGPGAIRAEVGG